MGCVLQLTTSRNTHKHTTGVPSPRISFGLVKSVDDPSDSRIGKGVMVAPKGLHVAAELDS